MICHLLAALALVLPQQHDPQIQTYCDAKTTSFGCLPFIRASGLPSQTTGLPFHVSAEDGRFGSPGFLMFGTKKALFPYHGGTLCVKFPFARTDPQVPVLTGSTQCSVRFVSRMRVNFNQVIQSGAEPFLTAGQRVYAQWRQQDFGNPWGFDDNFTDAVAFTICP